MTISDVLTFEPMALLAILGMAVATYLTRAGGFWLMGHVDITPRLERFLRHLAGGVLIAIVVAAAMRGDGPLWLALGVVVAVTLITRKAMLAMVAGVAAAALLRYFGL